eukprot:TRINITY_DN18099_c0_g1_i1.p1 TRINITY_DN18099_c0_g1~~TRINITY_DN18099_c0_g1_i1.p1  ORF type:complete len:186 (-),score=30.10 TRINITY_DN18099_c0_g1_i1:30-587(-)
MAVERWNNFYKSMDADNSGDFTESDADISVKRFLKWMNIKEGTTEAKRATDSYHDFWGGMIRAIDNNGDGKVTKPEFDSFVQNVLTMPKSEAPAWWKAAANKLFSVVDTNGNGELDFEEIKTYAQNIHMSVSEETIRQTRDWALKATGKSKIDAEGFMDLIWLWSTKPEKSPELDLIFAFWNHNQ